MDEEVVWKCPKHPIKLWCNYNFLICFCNYLATLCPDCTNVCPHTCNATAAITSSLSSFYHVSLDTVEGNCLTKLEEKFELNKFVQIFCGHLQDIKLILHGFGSNILFSNGLRDPYKHHIVCPSMITRFWRTYQKASLLSLQLMSIQQKHSRKEMEIYEEEAMRFLALLVEFFVMLVGICSHRKYIVKEPLRKCLRNINLSIIVSFVTVDNCHVWDADVKIWSQVMTFFLLNYDGVFGLCYTFSLCFVVYVLGEKFYYMGWFYFPFVMPLLLGLVP